jgi:putative PIN family toxin of toxin-antitoxin system
MKVVLDTNVWLDWLVFADPSSAELARAAESGALELLATAATRAEWIDVIGRPQFALDAAARAAVAARYDLHARVADDDAAAVHALICRDPDDQKFIDLALASGAPFLVTRDRALLDLARQASRRHALAIVRPEAPAWCEALAARLAGAVRD